MARVSDPTTVFPSDLAGAPEVRVTLLLADAAQVADHKIYVLGGGLTAVGPRPQPVAVALVLTVPWDRANLTHQWSLELLDATGAPVPSASEPLVVRGRFEAGRPAGLAPGSPRAVPLAINFPTMPVVPGNSYVWLLRVDGRTDPDWQLPFHVRSA